MPFTMRPLDLDTDSVSINGDVPLTALPIGTSQIVAVDVYTSAPATNLLTPPPSAKWVSFSGTTDFIVAFNGGALAAALPAAGTPDTTGGPDKGLPTEINPGLRRLPDSAPNKMSIRGISAAGYVTVSYYA